MAQQRVGGPSAGAVAAPPSAMPTADQIAGRHVVTRRIDDLAVVVPQGSVDVGMLEDASRRVTVADDDALLVDLSECMITDLGVRACLVPEFWGLSPSRFCVVCDRLTGRRLLARAGVCRKTAVFSSTLDARRARQLHRDGHGPGWNLVRTS